MRKKELNLLEVFLYRLALTISDNTPGLSVDFMDNRLNELNDIFRPIKAKKRTSIPK